LHKTNIENFGMIQELSVWRKQASINIQEEFAQRTLPPGLEDSLPPNLPDLFATVRAGVRRAADLYIALCTIAERLGRRQEGLAGEYGRMGAAWHALASEAHADVYAGQDVRGLNAGVEGTARGVEQARGVLEDEARSGEAGGLEDLKTMRDALVSMRELFERREKGARDTIPALEKRILANETKLRAIEAKGEQAKAGEAQRVGEAIMKVRVLLYCEDYRRPWMECSSVYRTNSPSWNSTRVASSSKSACGTRSCTSTRRSTGCRGWCRIGRRSGSNTPSSWRRTGAG